MAQILVKTPITSNGRDPFMENGKIKYSETILEAAARPILEQHNNKLPTHLKHIIEDYTPPVVEEVKVSAYTKMTKEQLTAELDKRKVPYDEKATKADLVAVLEYSDTNK